MVGDATCKNVPPTLEILQLAGRRVFNRKMGDELVRGIGAVKYFEYSRKSGRDYKIIIDEIIFAYFSKLRDEEDRQRMGYYATKKNKPKPVFRKVSRCSSLYLVFISVF